jgi:EAL domain-containing protein (putative c-di-GMP-specific phosphodiesterase class I)
VRERIDWQVCPILSLRGRTKNVGCWHERKWRDFGTRYSSLSYLQRFPFDKIKIDRCFVTDITEPGGSSCIVRAVANIAAERHMTTTAERVETLPQQELPRALGCTEMQGYLFSAAKPAAEIRQLFFTHRARPVAVA